jgi:hypothetical protein
VDQVGFSNPCLLLRPVFKTGLIPFRSDSLRNGERDRPGCSSRRLADWLSQMNTRLNSSPGSRQSVSGQRPKTAGETPALPYQLLISLRFQLSAFQNFSF